VNANFNGPHDPFEVGRTAYRSGPPVAGAYQRGATEEHRASFLFDVGMCNLRLERSLGGGRVRALDYAPLERI
jgi:hypothetical protein